MKFDDLDVKLRVYETAQDRWRRPLKPLTMTAYP